MTDTALPNQYVCELCKKEFSQKIDYTRHKNKKSPCISIEQIKSITQEQEVKTDNKGKLATIFKYCLDVLRSNEHLTGDKALRTLAHLLDLRLLEPQFGTLIDIDGYTGYKVKPETKEKLLSLARFSVLSRQKEDNIPVQMKALWDEILSVHPVTKNIFLKGKGFDIQHQSTYKKLIDKLFEFKFETMDEDILGEAYEEVIKDVMVGKTLGQFFTPPSVKQMMVDLVDPQIKTDGTCETVFDPAMGTGGFLITCLRHMMKKSKTLNIPLNWEYIINSGIGGREPEPDTYQLAVSNMLIASGHMLNHLEKGDSIRNTITNKYDIILANPPYGIKGLNYFEIVDELRNEYLPISSNSAVPLFIQAIIYMLNIGGRCAVVLPEGQELFSKNRTLSAVREFLMKTCDLKEVIYLPAGTFTHTSIKTCVLYFHKKKEGKDVLKVDIKISPTSQQEIQRDYKFSATHQTHKVAFYDYNPSNGVKHQHLEVDISDIAKKGYSLNYAEYLRDEAEDAVYDEGVVVKTLGEICEFQNGSQLDKKDVEPGEYPIYGGGFKIMGCHSKFNRFGNETIVCGTGAYAGHISYNNGNKFWASQCFTMKSFNETILNSKYLYYYSKVCLELKFMSNQKGTAIPFIRYNQIIDVKIPIPPLEKQQEIVKYMDFIYETVNKSSDQKIKELKQLNEYCLNMQKEFGLNTIKPLGEVCNFDIGGTPSRSNIDYYENGTNLWISVRELNGGYIFDTNEKITDVGVSKSSVKLFNIGTILFSFKLSIGKTAIAGVPLYTNEAIAGINTKNESILLNKYLYQYLTINDFTQKGSGMLGNGSLNKKSLYDIKIIIPSLERQKEIAEYCEFNDNLIKQLEREIEQNKKQAQIFLSNIIKVVGTKTQSDPVTLSQETEPKLTVPVTNDDTTGSVLLPEEQQSQMAIDPAKFTPDYLAQLSLTDLKQMKKQHKIRTKVIGETVDEYARILHEWYVMQHAENSKTRVKKPVVAHQPIESVININNIANITNTTLTLDLTVPNT